MRRHERLRAQIPVRCVVRQAAAGTENSDDTSSRRDRATHTAAGPPSSEPPPEVTISDALSIGLAKVGEAANLEPLAWRATDLGGEPLIEGIPLHGSVDPVGACQGWARLLKLEEYTFDVGDGERTWFRCEGDWQIEVTTARRDLRW
jgi:hypothetical protein